MYFAANYKRICYVANTAWMRPNDNGIHFATRRGTEACWVLPFDRICVAREIEHRLT